MRRLLILLFLTTISVGMSADQVETLIVMLKDGSQTSFFLKDKPQVTFEGSNLKVSSAVGDATYALSDVLRFTYTKSDLSGINEAVTPSTDVFMQDEVLVISQLKAGVAVNVYALDGKLLRQFTPSHTGTFRLNLSELSSGLYLVKVGTITCKITKR